MRSPLTLVLGVIALFVAPAALAGTPGAPAGLVGIADPVRVYEGNVDVIERVYRDVTCTGVGHVRLTFAVHGRDARGFAEVRTECGNRVEPLTGRYYDLFDAWAFFTPYGGGCIETPDPDPGPHPLACGWGSEALLTPGPDGDRLRYEFSDPGGFPRVVATGPVERVDVGTPAPPALSPG